MFLQKNSMNPFYGQILCYQIHRLFLIVHHIVFQFGHYEPIVVPRQTSIQSIA